jgi:hypothetical protein
MMPGSQPHDSMILHDALIALLCIDFILTLQIPCELIITMNNEYHALPMG